MQHKKLDTDTLGGLFVSLVGILVAAFLFALSASLDW